MIQSAQPFGHYLVVSDHSQSTSTGVNLFIRRAVPDESFIMMVSEEEKRRGSSLRV